MMELSEVIAMSERVRALLAEVDQFNPEEWAELIEELGRRKGVRGWLAATEPISQHFTRRGIGEADVDAAFDQDRAEQSR
jgi:hypothetical protein